MPTPVAIAMQCLTSEAGQALEEAVNVAKRRGHCQTTSLHAIFALLTIPSSHLRDACFRARNSACSSRVQFKALELCLSVSLDRVPSPGQPEMDPPVSNSLMAAIKRSQANQRRQPERFHLYHRQLEAGYSSLSGTQPSVSCVRVELPNLILAILDDPVVSRVFAESGFWSPDIKMALLRPMSHMFRWPHLKASRPATVFWSDRYLNNCLVGSASPYERYAAGNSGGEDIGRVIGELFVREHRKNPVFVGACAFDVLGALCDFVGNRKEMSFSPAELSGLQMIELGTDVRRFLWNTASKERTEVKFEDLGRRILSGKSSLGVILNIGDLRAFVKDEISQEQVNEESLGYLVRQLASFIRGLQGPRRVWITAALERYETYSKLVTSCPSIEMDWDLQLLPVSSSFRAHSTSEPHRRSSGVEAFAPLGGFVPTPSLSFRPASLSHQLQRRCNICDEKFKQEVAVISNSEMGCSVADQYQSCLPSWLQMAEMGIGKCRLLKVDCF